MSEAARGLKKDPEIMMLKAILFHIGQSMVQPKYQPYHQQVCFHCYLNRKYIQQALKKANINLIKLPRAQTNIGEDDGTCFLLL